MEIYELKVTSNFFEQLDNDSCHVELNNNIRCVFLLDTEFTTMEDFKNAIESLIF